MLQFLIKKELASNKNKILDCINHTKNKEASDCLKLILLMGIRPGSTTDTKGEVTAYGASTLQGRHVVVENNKVYLRFIGKKGVDINLPVTDKNLASMLLTRKQKAGDNGNLFNASASQLRQELRPLGLYPKDLRTRLANEIAITELKKISVPETAEEFQKIRKQIGKMVSSKSGNTPSVALSYYVNPVVFQNWAPEAYKKWIALLEQKTKEKQEKKKQKEEKSNG